MIAHLLLPWLFYAGSVAHRSWVGARARHPCCFAAVVACAPVARARARACCGSARSCSRSSCARAAASRGSSGSSCPALAARRAARLVPAARRATRGGSSPTPACRGRDPRSARMPPGGRCWPPASPPPTWSAGSASLPGRPTWWVPLLAAPLALLALVAPLTQRWAAGIALLVIAASGIATAFAAVGISVSFAQSLAVPLWPGTGLSLAWLGALGGALVALDIGLAPRLRRGALAGRGRRHARAGRARGARADLDGARGPRS